MKNFKFKIYLFLIALIFPFFLCACSVSNLELSKQFSSGEGCSEPVENEKSCENEISQNLTIENDEKVQSEKQNDVFTITFNSNGGTEIPSQEVRLGEKIEKPADPEKTGSSCFDGWFLGDKKWNFETDVVSESITLVAKWEWNNETPLIPFVPQD